MSVNSGSRGRACVCLGSGVLVLALVCGATLQAADPAGTYPKNGDAESGTPENWNKAEINTQQAHAGKCCFQRVGPAMISTSEFMPVDVNKKYTLTGWFKSAGEKPSRLYLGYIPCDKNKHAIGPRHVGVVPNTETTLTQACTKTDTVITIANGDNWRPVSGGCIAFEVDDSGEYNDLPNRHISANAIAKVEKKETHWQVHLTGPCKRAFPAGTKVRQHAAGGSYIYNAASNKIVPADWTQYTGFIKGEAQTGTPANKWRRGTKFARVLILAYSGQKGKDCKLLFDDISVTPE